MMTSPENNYSDAALAPIVLFAYNRPEHTLKTLEALALNAGAEASTLYIYADGARTNADAQTLSQVEAVRKLIRSRQWTKVVHIMESPVNKGLAASIIEGVTAIVNDYGKVIVLEDDIVTSKGFLRFMNEALTMYEQVERVMHISGYMFPVNKKLPATFFYTPTSCWGWGTWASAWKHFQKDPAAQIDAIEKFDQWKTFTIDYANMDFKNQVLANLDGVKNTWAIFWQASVFLAGGTSLHPYPSLVNNIGFDGSGENCDDNSVAANPYSWSQLADFVPVERKNNYDDKTAYKAMHHFFMAFRPKVSFLQKLKSKLVRTLKG